MTNLKPISHYTALAVLCTGLLTACGGGGGSSAQSTGGAETVAAGAVPTFVNNVIAQSSDSTSPLDVNLTSLTEDDTAEPAAVL